MNTLKNNIELVLGRQYHTTWQRKPGVVFILVSINEDTGQVELGTKSAIRTFWTKSTDLVDINRNKQ